VALLALVSRLFKFSLVSHVATEYEKLNYKNLVPKILGLVTNVQTGVEAWYFNDQRVVLNYTG